jgi:hypothetical protein
VGLGSHIWRLSDRVRYMAQEDEGARGDRDKNEREHDREAHALRGYQSRLRDELCCSTLPT